MYSGMDPSAKFQYVLQTCLYAKEPPIKINFEYDYPKILVFTQGLIISN